MGLVCQQESLGQARKIERKYVCLSRPQISPEYDQRSGRSPGPVRCAGPGDQRTSNKAHYHLYPIVHCGVDPSTPTIPMA